MRASLRRCAALAFCATNLLTALARAEDPAPPPHGVGLVLGGGGARGLAHIGVIEELERLRIPITCIAGTSAGALIGGIYASGVPIGQIQKDVESADWTRLLDGSPRRAELPYFRKRDDFKNLASMTLGVSNNGVLIPRAAVSTQDIDIFLRRLTRDVYVSDFSTLPIPFQAVATNLVDGEAVEFKGGDLAIALRASMAVPGVFDLVDTGENLLVDGMLVRNVPVQNVKNRCADTVIVVDVGTQLLKADEIHSLLDVASQQSNILVRRNVSEQLALMGPDDVLIRPDLTGYGAADFASAKDLVLRGRASVASLVPQLERYSVSEAEYAKWKQSLVARAPKEMLPYDSIEVAKTRYVPEGLASEVFENRQNKPTTQKELIGELDRLYATGDFDRVGYILRDVDGKRVADVFPVERAVGPNYLRFGLDFKIDSYYKASIAFLANLQFNWVNRWGAQWRNDARIGSDPYVLTEFIQPFGLSGLFGAASARAGRNQFTLYDEDRKFAVFGLDTVTAGLDLGYSLGRYGEARIGLAWSQFGLDVDIGPQIGSIEGQFTGVTGRLVIDQLDNPRFPRQGYYMHLTSEFARNTDQSTFATAELEGDIAHTFDKLTARGSVRFNGAFQGEAAESGSIHSIGGFLNLSGFQDGQFVGSRTALARLMLYQQVVSSLPTLGSGMYLGASAEAGRVWGSLTTAEAEKLLTAGSVFIGFDTFLGPLFVAYGQGEGGRKAGYLYLGVDY
ncbi:patatin-like phospholipase family protein [Niveibacterium sp. SC-1]|uniref:patatin-like phospholipase family protein n=1 Tax=Niveibacterium sp. SC-1 TaxID=3135646 RepID=UPI00311EB830